MIISVAIRYPELVSDGYIDPKSSFLGQPSNDNKENYIALKVTNGKWKNNYEIVSLNYVCKYVQTN